MTLIKTIIGKLKEYELISLVIAICYFAGYFSYTYHYRLLGLSNVSGNALEYLTDGGDFFISSIIKTIQTPFEYPKYFLFDLFFGEFKITTWIIVFILILPSFKLISVRPWIERTTTFLTIILLFIFNFVLLNWQRNNLNINSVLTVQPERIYLEFKDKGNFTPCELLEETYKQHLNFLKLYSPSVYKRVDKWFNMLSTEDLSRNRLISYSSLFLLFILELFIYSITIKPRFEKKIIWSVLVILLLINFIFLPISYGYIGRSFQMPYSKFILNTPDSIQNRVYILKEEKDQYIIYDKMNFFQIKDIPKSSVREIDQLFSLTPFQSPFNKQYSLCDSLLIIPSKVDY